MQLNSSQRISIQRDSQLTSLSLYPPPLSLFFMFCLFLQHNGGKIPAVVTSCIAFIEKHGKATPNNI